MTSRARTTLGMGDARGEPGLREALAGMLSRTRGLAAGADDVLVTRGSQMALFLVARALIRPGDVVAVEALGYRPAWDALRLAGARHRHPHRRPENGAVAPGGRGPCGGGGGRP